MSKRRFAQNDREAEQRAAQWKSKDPFPKVAPALLNSADIFAYIHRTAMVFPFDSSQEVLDKKLKSASYEVDFLGDIYMWNQSASSDSGPQSKEIEIEESYTIPKNSIVFVSPQTIFRLPDYIALRFNLRITHVHRGLLLGTGPLIDPGFEGRLLIPLHNMTSEDYKIKGGDGLIWAEFTKLSPNMRWDSSAMRWDSSAVCPGCAEEYHAFPKEKMNTKPHKYFQKAADGAPIRSSIPIEVETTKKDAKDAKDSAKAAEKKVKFLSVLGFGTWIALVIALFALAYQVVGLLQDANAYVRDSQAEASSLRSEFTVLKNKITNMDRELSSLKAEVGGRHGEKMEDPSSRGEDVVEDGEVTLPDPDEIPTMEAQEPFPTPDGERNEGEE